MSWVEVDGAGWRWVRGLVIPFTIWLKSCSECALLERNIARTI